MKKDHAAFDDIMKLDLRVGKVLSAKAVENSKKLIELTVDLGEDYGTTTILTGMLMYYSPEEFVGKSYAFIANLAPKAMAGSSSNGMILAADATERPVLLPLPEGLSPGTIIR
jgi:methionine--tRNA ligase beta chain